MSASGYAIRLRRPKAVNPDPDGPTNWDRFIPKCNEMTRDSMPLVRWLSDQPQRMEWVPGTKGGGKGKFISKDPWKGKIYPLPKANWCGYIAPSDRKPEDEYNSPVVDRMHDDAGSESSASEMSEGSDGGFLNDFQSFLSEAGPEQEADAPSNWVRTSLQVAQLRIQRLEHRLSRVESDKRASKRSRSD